MKLKFLSRRQHQRWITIKSTWISFAGSFQWILSPPLGRFLSFKEDNKEVNKIFLFRYIPLLPGQAATKKSSYEPTARGNGFNFPGATRDVENRKYPTNSAQVSYKLSGNYFSTLHWNFPSQWAQNYYTNVWFMNEAVCSSVKKIASEGRN